MIYAVIDLGARTRTYARAGHTPLIARSSSGTGLPAVQILVPDGMVLGVRIDRGEMFERLLVEQTLPLDEGDLLLFFTDGISEAMNERGDCFGESQLAELVEEHGHLPVGELRERILREIAAFVGGAPAVPSWGCVARDWRGCRTRRSRVYSRCSAAPSTGSRRSHERRQDAAGGPACSGAADQVSG